MEFLRNMYLKLNIWYENPFSTQIQILNKNAKTLKLKKNFEIKIEKNWTISNFSALDFLIHMIKE